MAHQQDPLGRSLPQKAVGEPWYHTLPAMISRTSRLKPRPPRKRKPCLNVPVSTASREMPEKALAFLLYRSQDMLFVSGPWWSEFGVGFATKSRDEPASPALRMRNVFVVGGGKKNSDDLHFSIPESRNAFSWFV